MECPRVGGGCECLGIRIYAEGDGKISMALIASVLISEVAVDGAGLNRLQEKDQKHFSRG